MMDIEIEKRLDEGAKELGIVLVEEQRKRLLGYVDLLKRWNKTYNLTALKTDEQILVYHILDSLAVVPSLRQCFSKEDSITALDVGSGGGLPGVVLAIMNPSWCITCIDAVEKKTSFVTLVAGMLGLKNLFARHTRIEKYQTSPVDLVISRAFASLADFANLAGHHVATGGHLVAMKGHYLDDEVQELEKSSSWRIENYQPIQVPQLDAERCLIYLKLEGKEIG